MTTPDSPPRPFNSKVGSDTYVTFSCWAAPRTPLTPRPPLTPLAQFSNRPASSAQYCESAPAEVGTKRSRFDSPVVHTRYAHSSSLKKGSEWMAKELLEAHDGHEYTLSLRMSVDEQVAAEVLLHFMHSGDFAAEVQRGLHGDVSCKQEAPGKCKLLVQLYVLAVRFNVPAATKACEAAVAEISERQELAEVEDMNCIFSEPGNTPAELLLCRLRGLKGRCMDALVARVNEEFNACSPSNQLCKRVIPKLVFLAMHSLVCSDKLHLCTENDVVALLNCWVHNCRPTVPQLESLSQAVRVKHLTPGFQAHLKQIAPWFKATQEELTEVMVMTNCLGGSGYSPSTCPTAWYGPRRQPLSDPVPPHQVLVLTCTGELLGAAFKKTAESLATAKQSLCTTVAQLAIGDCRIVVKKCEYPWPNRGYHVKLELVMEPELKRPFNTILLKVAVTISPWVGWGIPLSGYEKGWHVPMQCDWKLAKVFELGGGWCVNPPSDANLESVTEGDGTLKSVTVGDGALKSVIVGAGALKSVTEGAGTLQSVTVGENRLESVAVGEPWFCTKYIQVTKVTGIEGKLVALPCKELKLRVAIKHLF